MPQGIQINNPDGSVQFDGTSRLFRVLTAFDIGTANSGSVSVSGVQGTLRVVAQPATLDGEAPDITVSGTTVSYSYRGQPTRQPVRVVMMEY